MSAGAGHRAAEAERQAPLVLTMGEPAGIGAEITIKAWLRRREGLPAFAIIADPAHLEATAAALDVDVALAIIDEPGDAPARFGDALPVIAEPLAAVPAIGRPTVETAPAVRRAIERAVAFVRAGRARAVVTNPIHKEIMYRAGFDYPGHTEFLGTLSEGPSTPVMMLAARDLRVVPLTTHVPLARAASMVTRERIVETAHIVDRELRHSFAVTAPRLAVAGLNPHAGEGGAIGDEEQRTIAPAIADLRAAGLAVAGPVSPDTLFSPDARTGYDAAICMYHDQALVPIKALYFDQAVNTTLGLSFVRTSPDHGTALDIAGTGRADESSLVAALHMAAEMGANRDIAAAA